MIFENRTQEEKDLWKNRKEVQFSIYRFYQYNKLLICLILVWIPHYPSTFTQF